VEAKAQLLRAPQTLRNLRFERAEIRRLRASLPQLPSARTVTVIPTYRRRALLAVAIQSALAQTDEDHVVVVVDDAGGEVVDFDHPRLTQVSLSRNVGVAGVVRNVGIGISASRYCAFLDDDNVWLPNHLRVAIDALEGGADLVYSGLERVDAGGAVTAVLSDPFDRRRLRSDNFVDTSMVTMRRARWARFSRMPRRFGDVTIEDWELVRRVSRRHVVVHAPEVTVRYLVHEGSYYTDR
jgi:glycosyltransferase involved in cell wall biosynthesis